MTKFSYIDNNLYDGGNQKMVLIKNYIERAITMLEDLLIKCVDEETIIRINGNIDGVIIRYSSSLEEFYVNQDKISLVCGWFELNIQKNVTNIEYSEDEKSIHIIFSDGELYIDM